MIQLIVGNKGKGKTKHLLDKVNEDIKTSTGNIVYLDKSAKHMYELNNKIRLIDVSEYMLTDSAHFVGFIAGIISQDHDLEQMFLDSFLKIAKLEDTDITLVLKELEAISKQFNVNFVLSVSMDEKELPEFAKPLVLVSL